MLQVIGSLKQKIDEYMSRQSDAENEIKQARWFLIERETRLFNMRKRAGEYTGSANNAIGANNISDPFKRDEPKRRSLSSSISSMFRRASQIETPSMLMVNREREEECTDTLTHTQSNWFKERTEIKNYALCSIILEEWLKELAAISQEHTIAQLNTIFK